jgi:hypothetical protein
MCRDIPRYCINSYIPGREVLVLQFGSGAARRTIFCNFVAARLVGLSTKRTTHLNYTTSIYQHDTSAPLSQHKHHASASMTTAAPTKPKAVSAAVRVKMKTKTTIATTVLSVATYVALTLCAVRWLCSDAAASGNQSPINTLSTSCAGACALVERLTESAVAPLQLVALALDDAAAAAGAGDGSAARLAVQHLVWVFSPVPTFRLLYRRLHGFGRLQTRPANTFFCSDARSDPHCF